MDHADASQFANFSETQNYGSIIDRVRLKSQQIRRRDDEVKNFAKLDKKKKNAKKKISSISRSGLELFYI